MKPETAQYLDKARQALKEARATAGIELGEAAGRAAYLAVFHAAQAMIFERDAKVPKTHRGVHAQFSRWRETNRLSAPKAVADYEIGPDATVPLAEAISATDAAENFVGRIADLLE